MGPPCSAPSLGVFLITVLRGSGRWLDGVPAVSRVLSLLLQLPVSSLHGLQSFSVSLLVLFAILLQKSSSGSELMTVWTCSLSTASLAWSDSSPATDEPEKTESNINPSDRHGIPQHSEMINGQSPEEGSSGHEHTGVMGDRHGIAAEDQIKEKHAHPANGQ